MAKQARAAGGLSTPAGNPATHPKESPPRTPGSASGTGGDPAPARTDVFVLQRITIQVRSTGDEPDPYRTKALVHPCGLAIHAIAFSDAETLGENFWGCISHVASGLFVIIVSPMQARAAVEILASTGCPWTEPEEAVNDWSTRHRAWMPMFVQALRDGDLGRARTYVEKYRTPVEAQ